MLAISQVLNKILQTKNFDIIKKNSLDENYFKGFTNEFNFICQHFKNYGNVPDIETFIQKFPNFQLYEVNETDDYLLDRLYEEYGFNKFVPIIPQLNKLLEVDSREAYSFLSSEMNNLKPHTVCKGVDIISSSQERYEKYITRKEDSNATIKTGLIELDDIFGGWEYGEELVTIVARTNQGKCLKKGTLVLMADTTYKKVEDIKVGDKVISYNSVNTVISTHEGISGGYYIKPDSVDSFIVTNDHIMTLWCETDNSPIEFIECNNKRGTLIDITIEEFLQTPYTFQQRCYLYCPRINKLCSFTVKRIKKKFEYAGFACDGDHRFILKNEVLTHNSWMLLKFLAEAWKQGVKIGLYSGEMSALKLGYRFDALFGHFSNRCLTLGAQLEGYKDYIDNLKGLTNPFIIVTQKELGGRPTVQKIRNFIEENNIGCMGIDQYSLMQDGRASVRDPMRIQMAHISEDLFSLSSEYKIPILGLAQANREGAKKDNEQDAPGLENIKECDDIAANSSKALGIKQSSFGLVLDIIKNREGKVGDKLLYSWDIDTGHFSYIPSNGDAASTQIRQQVQQQTKQQFAQNTSVNPF